MKHPTREHIDRVLQRERDLAPWLFSPCRDDQERAQVAHGLARLNAQRELQPELQLCDTP